MQGARNLSVAGRCPRCSFVVTGSTTVCEQCGALVPLERITAETSDSLRGLRFLLGRRLRDMDLHQIAMLLACIPLVVGPPVIALLIAGVQVIQDGSVLRLRDWQKPIVVALVNTVLSVLVWHYLSGQVWDAISHVFSVLGAALPDGETTTRVVPIGA